MIDEPDFKSIFEVTNIFILDLDSDLLEMITFLESIVCVININ